MMLSRSFYESDYCLWKLEISKWNNVNGYVGESTKKEIEFAKEKGKEIIYYTDFAHK